MKPITVFCAEHKHWKGNLSICRACKTVRNRELAVNREARRPSTATYVCNNRRCKNCRTLQKKLAKRERERYMDFIDSIIDDPVGKGDDYLEEQWSNNYRYSPSSGSREVIAK